MKTFFNGLHTTYTTDEGNRFVWSSLNEFSHEWRSGLPATTVRYVITGYEAYNLNSETVRVGPAKFLVVNKAQRHSVHIPYTSEPVTGFCVALNNALLNDVYHNHLEGDDSLLDNPFTKAGKEFHFCEDIYEPGDPLSRYLSMLQNKFDPATGELFVSQDELFFDVAERLLVSQTITRKKISNITASKHSTRQELYKRIAKAKIILDEEDENGLPVATIAAMVALSEFHFYRIFKQIYNISPHQYRIKKRLQRARLKLCNTDMPVTGISHESGFADLQSFSKAFRKEFFLSPKRFRDASKSI